MDKKLEDQVRDYIRELKPEKTAWLQRYFYKKNIHFSGSDLASAQLTRESFNALQNASRVYDHNAQHGKTTISITKTLKKRLKSLAIQEHTEMTDLLDRLISGEHLKLTDFKKKHKQEISKLESEIKTINAEKFFWMNALQTCSKPVTEQLELLRIQLVKSSSEPTKSAFNGLIDALAETSILPESEPLKLTHHNNDSKVLESEQHATNQDAEVAEKDELIKKHLFEFRTIALCLRHTKDIKTDKGLLTALSKLKQSLEDTNG